jgi:hypothetical protein
MLPLLFPAVVAPAWVLAEVMGLPVPRWIGDGMLVALMGAFLFLPVYAPVVALILFILRTRPWAEHAVAAALAPLLMTIGIGAVGCVIAPEIGFIESVRTWGPFSLGLGYFYVCLACAGMWVIEKAVGFSNERSRT